MTETEQVFNSLSEELIESKMTASGIPEKYNFIPYTQAFKIGDCIHIYPKNGGCVILEKNGTWTGDIAPFSG